MQISRSSCFFSHAVCISNMDVLGKKRVHISLEGYKKISRKHTHSGGGLPSGFCH